MKSIVTICFVAFLVSACSGENSGSTIPQHSLKQKLQELSVIRTASEKNNDLKNFLSYYDKNAISMPEYQPTLTGIDEIETFYKEIFQRQKIKSFQREIDEIIDLGSTIIEIGVFKKEYAHSDDDELLTQNGKYWNIWEAQSDSSFKLKGESYGFFHPIENPGALTVQNITPNKSAVYLEQKIPFELRAYNALNEKYVRIRDGALRSDFYMHDAKFMPFQEPTVSGIEEIKPYLIEYSSRGDVTIDSIAVYTYHYEYIDDHILEYAKFKVRWTVPGFSGRTEGKGIRIWKRQEDKSIKMYRQIGTHNHLE